jgi:hypothetical protein
MSKKVDRIGDLIARKKEAKRINLPKHIEAELLRVFEHNDSYSRNSHERISAEEMVDALGEMGFITNRNALRRIAKQLGRRGYGEK